MFVLIPPKAPRLTRAPRTGREPGSARPASVRVLVALTSSTGDSPSSFVSPPLMLSASGGYNVPLGTNPFNSWATVIDCGDIPVTSY